MVPIKCQLKKCVWKWKGTQIPSHDQESDYYLADNSIVTFTEELMNNQFSLSDWSSLKLITKDLAIHGRCVPQNSDNMCSICLDEINCGPPFELQACHHMYHFHCLKKWANEKNTCPLDRIDISDVL